MISTESRLLIIDTSTNYLSLGIHQNGHTHSIYEAVGAKQSELILPRIQQLLDTASLTLAQLDAIVYAQGPGAFTGLRIGLGVATGLALPNNLPLIGIPCLDAVAALAPNQPCVLAATDARMNELFFAWYDTQNHKRLSDYLVGSANSIQFPAGQHSAIGVGNAYALDITLPVSGQNLMPGAQEYAQLALSGRYTPTDAAQASLHYVRNKIALTAAEQAARRAAGQTA
ncbi:tRNA (adenosine(37)-N6)-threonylcarbamoyltransferase complex dimerization subunit type 1 TsaB [Snodgrassella gandavensis]|uniref:tRNA (adenosine(37)-N6)-threonylcarbamoyltransferase complex dimerization subunit type 1 TsaB n=1 Tax=Snodgrassella gandavensis TaxID=2946698 RepID=UPI001EF4C922|nr:tRNA (adenosine(37)-N6)-threonylcarbamoyltransferase complex dimerization subunit type 1 TsaB [Snodgrassella gandavensis]